jgi:DnaK suppressor protein
MDNDDIKQKINDEIFKTEALIKEYRESAKPISPDSAIGRISRMDAINNKSIVEAALREAENKLRNLRRVFAQLGSEEFGICLKCKKAIPIGRILIRPESLLCVNCAQ